MSRVNKLGSESKSGSFGIDRLPAGSSLFLAINKSRNSRKRKSSFLGDTQSNTKGATSMKTSGISLGHVVFSGDSQSRSNSKSASLTNKFSMPAFTPSKRRCVSEPGKQRNSLWSKVAANGFGKGSRK